MQIYLSLGSNLGDKEQNIQSAIGELKLILRGMSISDIIKTKAIVKPGSPKEWEIPFLNCVVKGDCALNPYDLLAKCKEIEESLGRDLYAPRWSPRVIDIDILYYGDLKMDEPDLTIPHKELKNRSFLEKLIS